MKAEAQSRNAGQKQLGFSLDAGYPAGDFVLTATRLQQSAQRCHDNEVATLGNQIRMTSTLKGLNRFPARC